MRNLVSVFIGAGSLGLILSGIAIVVATRGFKFAPALFILLGGVGLVLAVIFFMEERRAFKSEQSTWYGSTGAVVSDSADRDSSPTVSVEPGEVRDGGSGDGVRVAATEAFTPGTAGAVPAD